MRPFTPLPSFRADGGWSSTTPRIRARRLPQPSHVELARRGATITRVVMKHFAPLALRQIREGRNTSFQASEIAQPLRRTFEELGGTFIKFGQIIASSPGMFGEEVSDEFRGCLDTGPPIAFHDVRQRIEDDLGMSLAEAFCEFHPDPIGSASMAVVYRARLHDGNEVAVKVLRPGVEHLVATDLDLMQPMLELLVRQTGDQMAGSTLQLLSGFREQIGEEIDLRNEARSLTFFQRLGANVGLPLLVVPKPFPEFSGPNVLTMEFFDGVPIDDLERAQELGIDPIPLIEQLVRGLFWSVIRWGAFHGDVHAGKMLLLKDGRIGMIDWGIVGRLDADTHQFLVKILSAVLGDESAWEDIANHISSTYGPAIKEGVGLDGDDLTRFIRSLIEPTLTLPFGQVSLASVFQTAQLQVAKAQGIQAHTHSIRAIAHRLRSQRRLRRMVDESGGMMTDFDRGTFLLGKQLMYFERYGKIFLSDTPIFNDREFFVRLLAGDDEMKANEQTSTRAD